MLSKEVDEVTGAFQSCLFSFVLLTTQTFHGAKLHTYIIMEVEIFQLSEQKNTSCKNGIKELKWNFAQILVTNDSFP